MQPTQPNSSSPDLTHLSSTPASDPGASTASPAATIQPPAPTGIRGALAGLLGSKKFLVTIAAVAVAVVGPIAHYAGASVDQTSLDRVLAALVGYVLSQGVADLGKGAAQTNSPSSVASAILSILSTLPRLGAVQGHSVPPGLALNKEEQPPAQ